MKSKALSIAIALCGIISANAQLYVGGSLNVSVGSQRVKQLDNKTNPSYSFSLSPEIGYNLSEKTAIGLSFSLGSSSSKNSNLGLSPDGTWIGVTNKFNAKSFQISPYFRYSLFKWKKINLLGTASVYAGKVENKNEYSYYQEEIVNKTKQTYWGMNVHPVLIYNLSGKWAIVSHLTFISFGFTQVKSDTNNPSVIKIENNYYLGLSTENVLPSIGIIYQF